MLLFTAVSLLFIVWIFILLVDFYLRQSSSERYIKFLEDYGVTFTPFQFRLYLTNLDRNPSQFSHFLHKSIDRISLGPRKSQILTIWFTLGAMLSLICFIFTPIYLIRLLISELSAFLPQTSHAIPTYFPVQQDIPSTALSIEQHSLLYIPLHEHINAGITPVFPGVNLPLSHLPIFISVLIVASIVHEAGHAIAAANANVRVTGLGVFLFAIYPGAFTEVEPDELERCSYAQKLRIYGAGIWHNICLALVGVLILISIPIFSFPFYSSNSGVIVTDIDSKSGLSGPTGLQPGYHITRINQCEVRNLAEWTQCFLKIQNNGASGFLAQYRAVSQMTASSEYIVAQTDGEVQCCGEFNVTSSTHICFRYLAPRKAINPVLFTTTATTTMSSTSTMAPETTPKPIFPNFPDFDADFGVHPRGKRANLKMRLLPLPTTEDRNHKENHKIPKQLPTQKPEFAYACLPAMQITEHALCQSTFTLNSLTSTLPPGYVCVVPALFNGTVLLRFKIKQHQKPVLFIGYLNEPLHMVDVTQLTPRIDFIPWWLPRIAELFARYLLTLSLAMGILNAVPCYGLDGQFISCTVVEYFCQNYSLSFKKRVERILMVIGTFVFCANIIIGFIKSFAY